MDRFQSDNQANLRSIRLKLRKAKGPAEGGIWGKTGKANRGKKEERRGCHA